VNVRFPVKFLPAASGAKLTPSWHIPPGGTPATQALLVRLKNCPATCGFVTRSFVLLLLCNVTNLIGAFPVPTFPKLSDFGEMVSLIGGGLGVAVAVGVEVVVAVAVAVLVGVAVTVAVAVEVSVAVAVAVGVAVEVAEAVGVAVAVAVAIVVSVAVEVGDALKVAVAVAVGVALAVGVAVASIDSNAPMSQAPLLSAGSGRGSPR
jgi:hypothetical protein